jgi:hypothetical protein
MSRTSLSKSEEIILLFARAMDGPVDTEKVELMCFILWKADPKRRYFKFVNGAHMVGFFDKLAKLEKAGFITWTR